MKPTLRDITGEAVAGLLWMYLDIPTDASRAELEGYASDLVDRIRVAGCDADIEQTIKALQVDKLCRPLNLAAISTVAKKSIAVVRAARV
jgi:hypothetical protein